MVRNSLQYMTIDTELRSKKIAEWNPPVWWPLLVLFGLLGVLFWPAWRALRQQAQQNAMGDVVETPK